MRASTAFNNLLNLVGVWVSGVEFVNEISVTLRLSHDFCDAGVTM